jgi:hypothetical protein
VIDSNSISTEARGAGGNGASAGRDGPGRVGGLGGTNCLTNVGGGAGGNDWGDGTAARVGLELKEPLLGSVAFGEETAVCFKIGLGAAGSCLLAFVFEERLRLGRGDSRSVKAPGVA